MPFEQALLSLDDGRRLRPGGEDFDREGRGRAGGSGPPRLLRPGSRPLHPGVCHGTQALRHPPAAIDNPGARLGLGRAELAVARLVATGLTIVEVASHSSCQ